MPNRNGQHNPQHSSHNPRTCNLCGVLRHPAQAQAGAALARHLGAHPFPRQAVTA